MTHPALAIPTRNLLWAVRVLKLIPGLTKKLTANGEDYSGIINIPEKAAYRLKNLQTPKGDSAILYVGGGEKGINNTVLTIPKLDAIYPARIYLRLIPTNKDSYATVVIDAARSMAYSKLVANPPDADPVDYLIRAEM